MVVPHGCTQPPVLSSRGGGGGAYFLVMGYWGCATGWGHIFTTLLTIMGSSFQAFFNRVTRMGSQVFGTLRVRKSFAKKWLRWVYNWPQNRPKTYYNTQKWLRWGLCLADRVEKRNTTSHYKDANGYRSSIFCIQTL